MADKNNIVGGNTAGKYFVDTNCIACGICLDEAPAHFRMSEDGANAEVFLQPQTEDEIKACENALSACPAEAIGNNGQ